VYTGANRPLRNSTVIPEGTGEVGSSTRALEGAAKLSRGIDVVGRAALPVAVVMDGIEIGNAYHQDGNSIGKNTQETVGSVAGGWVGGLAGAETGAEGGAVVGTFFGPVGTVVGGAVGGVAGGMVGSLAGSAIGNKIVDGVRWLFGK
jgi:hypothetical protein